MEPLPPQPGLEDSSPEKPSSETQLPAEPIQPAKEVPAPESTEETAVVRGNNFLTRTRERISGTLKSFFSLPEKGTTWDKTLDVLLKVIGTASVPFLIQSALYQRFNDILSPEGQSRMANLQFMGAIATFAIFWSAAYARKILIDRRVKTADEIHLEELIEKLKNK